jgi:hypothetical protein
VFSVFICVLFEERVMKKSSLLKSILVMAVVALCHGYPGCRIAEAQPFVVCDEYTTTMVQPQYFKVVLDGVQSNSTPETLANGAKRLHFDIGSVSVATHNMTVAACKAGDGVWSTEVCSEPVPFAFTRPAAVVVSKPSSIGLVR